MYEPKTRSLSLSLSHLMPAKESKSETSAEKGREKKLRRRGLTNVAARLAIQKLLLLPKYVCVCRVVREGVGGKEGEGERLRPELVRQ